MDTQRLNNFDPEPDLSPYLENSPLHVVAEFLHNNIFQPFDRLLEWLDTRFTKKLVEENLPPK